MMTVTKRENRYRYQSDKSAKRYSDIREFGGNYKKLLLFNILPTPSVGHMSIYRYMNPLAHMGGGFGHFPSDTGPLGGRAESQSQPNRFNTSASPPPEDGPKLHKPESSAPPQSKPRQQNSGPAIQRRIPLVLHLCLYTVTTSTSPPAGGYHPGDGHGLEVAYYFQPLFSTRSGKSKPESSDNPSDLGPSRKANRIASTPLPLLSVSSTRFG